VDETDSMTPEVLRVGVRVRGLSGAHAVTVKAVDRVSEDTWEVISRDDEGRTDTHLVYRENLTRLRIAEAGSLFAFGADAHGFRLAAEARRMRLAHLFDPQQALGTSDVDPLPHQLKAVYQDMLPKQPLRFVLADDPGSGKTIMAGLLVKELLLRGDATNVLIVAPGSLVDQWQDELADKFGLDARTLTRDVIDAERNPFQRGGLWLGRLDVLKNNSQGILDKACDIDWDLVIVDEAHKMSANVWAGEVRKSRRYELGERLGQHTRNLLLMTATPTQARRTSSNCLWRFWTPIASSVVHARARDASTCPI
jgi:SNF2 family DNA or RNA helicase